MAEWVRTRSSTMTAENMVSRNMGKIDFGARATGSTGSAITPSTRDCGFLIGGNKGVGANEATAAVSAASSSLLKLPFVSAESTPSNVLALYGDDEESLKNISLDGADEDAFVNLERERVEKEREERIANRLRPTASLMNLFKIDRNATHLLEDGSTLPTLEENTVEEPEKQEDEKVSVVEERSDTNLTAESPSKPSAEEEEIDYQKEFVDIEDEEEDEEDEGDTLSTSDSEEGDLKKSQSALPEDLKEWSKSEVKQWLRSVDIDKTVIKTFMDHSVVGLTLALLQLEDMTDILGLSAEIANDVHSKIKVLLENHPPISVVETNSELKDAKSKEKRKGSKPWYLQTPIEVFNQKNRKKKSARKLDQTKIQKFREKNMSKRKFTDELDSPRSDDNGRPFIFASTRKRDIERTISSSPTSPATLRAHQCQCDNSCICYVTGSCTKCRTPETTEKPKIGRLRSFSEKAGFIKQHKKTNSVSSSTKRLLCVERVDSDIKDLAACAEKEKLSERTPELSTPLKKSGALSIRKVIATPLTTSMPLMPLLKTSPSSKESSPKEVISPREISSPREDDEDTKIMLEMKQRAEEIKAGGTPNALKQRNWTMTNVRYSTALMKPVDDYKEQQELEALIKAFSIKFQLTSETESSDEESEDSDEEEGEASNKRPSLLIYGDPTTTTTWNENSGGIPIIMDDVKQDTTSPDAASGFLWANKSKKASQIKPTLELNSESIFYIETVIGKAHVRTNELRKELLLLLPKGNSRSSQANAPPSKDLLEAYTKVKTVNEGLKALSLLLQPLKLRRNALESSFEQKIQGLNLDIIPDDEQSGHEMLEKMILSSALLIDRLTKIFILLKCEISQTKDPIEVEVLRLIVKKIDKYLNTGVVQVVSPALPMHFRASITKPLDPGFLNLEKNASKLKLKDSSDKLEKKKSKGQDSPREDPSPSPSRKKAAETNQKQANNPSKQLFGRTWFDGFHKIDPQENDPKEPYKVGSMKILRSLTKWKTVQCVLNDHRLELYRKGRSKPLKSLFLRNIQQLSVVKKSDRNHVLQIIVRGNIIYLAVDTEEEANWWLLAIDGIKPKQSFAVIAPEERIVLLSRFFKENFQGGVIRSSNEDKWTYSSDGVVLCERGPYQNHEYHWNGEALRNKRSSINSKEYGKWNSVWLGWLDSISGKYLAICRWNPNTSSFVMEKGLEFKWNGYDLSSSDKNTCWHVEGQVPGPVVMLLELLQGLPTGEESSPEEETALVILTPVQESPSFDHTETNKRGALLNFDTIDLL
eukprot:TRINITY_DN5548_c0_g1_i1.p1 TRINITY_DN5548_c0_g1~~TRINITY_DN5548_c0_g1_i1.p1  ORF type:complete len:1273 (+),score=328.72 TRINITY_DN5548_c0_g1_i1:70-3888(+)